MANSAPGARKPPVVVRFNGGAQAGHTVQLEDGRRRIFSQLGSGLFLGCPTYLSEHFLFNPVNFVCEVQSWIQSECPFPKALPEVWIHPKAKVVVPSDLYLNQRIEEALGEKRHGSCGQGIGICMSRNLNGFDLVYEDLFDIEKLIPKLVKISNQVRAGSKLETSDYVGLGSRAWGQFFSAVKLLPRFIKVADYFDLPKNNVIFEGAQGLLLDEDDPDHQPHVTWSKTGITNVLDILQKMRQTNWNVDLDEVLYCTRPYLTRHGNGPMHAAIGGVECSSSDLELVGFKDDTNLSNPWQGDLRFGRLDLDKLMARIRKEISLLPKDREATRIGLSVSCSDQAPHLVAPLAERARKEQLGILLIDGLHGPDLSNLHND